jgi:hypothetical protein
MFEIIHSADFVHIQRGLDIFEQAVGANHPAFAGDDFVDVHIAEFFVDGGGIVNNLLCLPQRQAAKIADNGRQAVFGDADLQGRLVVDLTQGRANQIVQLFFARQ